MKNKKQIIEIFKRWGQSKQRFFDDHNDVKTRLLNSLKSSEKVRVHGSWPWFRMGVVAGACAVLLLLVFSENVSYPLSPLSRTAKDYQVSGGSQSASVPPTTASKEVAANDLGVSYSSYEPISYWNRSPDVNYKDSREYLKVYYQATIQTRKVDIIANRAQTTVRGYGGRIDSSSISKKSAYISFVVPKKSFEAFKTELKSLVGARFIAENLNSQNLLSQKVSIEDQTKTASSSIADYQSQKKDLTDKHNKTVAGYQSQLNYYSNQIWNAQQELKKTTSTALQAELQTRINSANNEWSRIKRLMDSENSDYNKKVAALDNQIKNQQNQLASLKTQDTNLTDDVETVQGTIMVSWVSYWGIIELYIPFYKWLIAGAMLIVILVAIFSRGRSFETV